MAKMNGRFGKDDPERFIDGALAGDIHGEGGREFQDSMTSNEMEKHPVDRKSQHILTATALDNVGRVYGRYDTSIKHTGGIAGGPSNLEHSLSGASAVNEGVGAAGHVKHVIIPNH